MNDVTPTAAGLPRPQVLTTGALSRRRVLTTAAALAAGGVIAEAVPAPAMAEPGHAAWTAERSLNRWPVVDRSKIAAFRIEGSDATAALLARSGGPSDAAGILLHVARRVHYEIAPLDDADVHGYTTDRTIRSAGQSNHLSGTAITLRPGAYPPGSSGNLFPFEVGIIRDILAECEGVVAWHGDDAGYPCEGQFHIDVPPGDPRLSAVAAMIRGWRTQPGAAAAPDGLA